MNILITGGAGFIGSNLAVKLIERGHQITILDNLSRQIHGNNPFSTSHSYRKISDKTVFIKGSVTVKRNWVKAIENQDVIVHLAAETGTGQSMYEIRKYTDVNIGGTSLMLDLLANSQHKVKKVVIASSRAIYGEGKYISKEFGPVYPLNREIEGMSAGNFEVSYPGCSLPLQLVPTDEGSVIHPTSFYGITKQVQEQMVMNVCKSIGISAVAFRYQNVYGPGQSLKNPYTGILSIFSTRIKNRNSINIFEDGEESRDFVFIDDAVEATILGIENKEADNQVFNVGFGVPVSVKTVVKELINNYGIDVPVNISGNFRLGDIRHNYADISKIKSILGFEPKISFEQGVIRFVQWAEQQSVNKDNYDISIEEMKAKGFFK